jgi:hypothetical protein
MEHPGSAVRPEREEEHRENRVGQPSTLQRTRRVGRRAGKNLEPSLTEHAQEAALRGGIGADCAHLGSGRNELLLDSDRPLLQPSLQPVGAPLVPVRAVIFREDTADLLPHLLQGDAALLRNERTRRPGGDRLSYSGTLVELHAEVVGNGESEDLQGTTGRRDVRGTEGVSSHDGDRLGPRGATGTRAARHAPELLDRVAERDARCLRKRSGEGTVAPAKRGTAPWTGPSPRRDRSTSFMRELTVSAFLNSPHAPAMRKDPAIAPYRGPGGSKRPAK